MIFIKGVELKTKKKMNNPKVSTTWLIIFPTHFCALHYKHMISLRILNFNKIKHIYNQKQLQNLYNHYSNVLVLSDCKCNCGSSTWYYHAYYNRRLIIHGYKYIIKVLRIQCTQCLCTHVILPCFIIPYLLNSIIDLKIKRLDEIEFTVVLHKRNSNFLIFVDST